jgi:hypothetical protein
MGRRSISPCSAADILKVGRDGNLRDYLPNHPGKKRNMVPKTISPAPNAEHKNISIELVFRKAAGLVQIYCWGFPVASMRFISPSGEGQITGGAVSVGIAAKCR